MHVHLENLTSKPRIFWLTPELVEATRHANPDLDQRVRFSVGADLTDLERNLKTAAVLVTSADVVCHPGFPRADLARAAPALRQIHLIGAAVDRVLPLDWLPEHVQLTNNSGVHVDKVREFLTMALLALNARLPQIVSNQTHGRWDPIFTPLIRGKTAAVIGLGAMGQAAVAVARSLGLEVVGVSRSGRPVPGVARVHKVEDLAVAVDNVDFIVIAIPLTPETRGLVDRKVLQRARRGAGLVNVGRAGVMDHAALTELLRGGDLGGAILDVLPEEPLPASSDLWSTPNLLITPHVAADDLDNYMTGTMSVVCDNLRRHLAGTPLENVVDRSAGY
jgi:phosphoglycerate dehydrogenase-like enzyme